MRHWKQKAHLKGWGGKTKGLVAPVCFPQVKEVHTAKQREIQKVEALTHVFIRKAICKVFFNRGWKMRCLVFEAFQGTEGRIRAETIRGESFESIESTESNS